MILQGIYIATGKYMIEDKKTRHCNKPNCMSDAVHFSDCDHYSLQIYLQMISNFSTSLSVSLSGTSTSLIIDRNPFVFIIMSKTSYRLQYSHDRRRWKLFFSSLSSFTIINSSSVSFIVLNPSLRYILTA